VELLQTFLLFGSALLYFFVSAKTHGRQIRLERELVGIDNVDVRRETPNHPWVEELWRKDRVHYWTRAGLVFILLVPLLSYFASQDRFDWWAILPIAILLSMSLAFTGQAFRSQFRLGIMMRSNVKDSLGPNPRHDDQPWRRDARRGTWFWFAATYVLSFTTLLALSSAMIT